jgi:small-conductance mechanosensitive channel
MDKAGNLGTALANAASAIFDRVIAYLPSVFGAIALLIIGWALARLLRALTMRAVMLLDKAFSRLGAPGTERLRMGRASVVMGTVVFWVVMLFFVTAATQVLGLEPFTNWLGQLVQYLPTLVAGLLIVAAGFVLSRIVSDLVRATATRLAPAQRSALARIAQVAIVVGAVLVGADQIGIKVTFLVVFVAAVAAAIVGGVALSVGLGARDYIANLIGAHYLRQALPAGQSVRIGEFEGRVIEVTATALILDTVNGRVSLPARVYNEQAITVIAQNGHG